MVSRLKQDGREPDESCMWTQQRIASRLRMAVMASLLTFGLAGSSAAAGNDTRVHYTTAGQAAARAAVITKQDFDSPGDWRGGTVKPDITPIACADFHPKQSDLTLNGAAQTAFFRSDSIEVGSLVEVLATPKLVRLDWQRTVGSPRLPGCIGTLIGGAFASSARFVSVNRLAFPQIGTNTSAWRVELETTTAAKKHFICDLILINRGRTEISITSSAPLESANSVKAIETRLAHKLFRRART